MKITKAPSNSGVLIIPLANELLEGSSATDIQTLEHEKGSYEVKEFFTYHKDQPFPTAMFFVATGQELSAEKVWEKYPNSDKIFLFVCTEVIIEKKEEQIKTPSLF